MIDLGITCPIKATLFIVRKNATSSSLPLIAPWDGEAFLVVQTQSNDAACIGIAEIVGQLPTAVLAQTRDNQSVEADVPTGTNVFGSRLELAKEADEVTADEPTPADVTDPCLIEWFERYNR